METGILTELMNRLLGALTGGQTQLLGLVRPVASALALIELAWAAAMWSFSTGDEAMKGFLTKVVKLGIWSFLILNFPEVVEGIRQFFVQVGLTASGAGGLPVAITDPSMIAEMGFDAVRTIWLDFKEQDSVLSVGFSVRALVAMLVLTFCALFILLLYYFIALSMFLTVVEFYIVSSLGVVFVPWGINAHTKWIAERYFGALVALGTKLSVQVFMASVTLPVLERFKLGPEPTFAQTFTLLLGVLAVALLNWRAPNVAAGMMSGSAALSTTDVTTPVANAAGMAMSAAGMLAAGPAGGAAGGAVAASNAALERGVMAGQTAGPAPSSGASSAGASVASSAATGGAAPSVAAATTSVAPSAGASSPAQAPSAPGGTAAPAASASPTASSASASTASSAPAPASSVVMDETAPVSAPGGRALPPDSGTRQGLPAVVVPAAPAPTAAMAPVALPPAAASPSSAPTSSGVGVVDDPGAQSADKKGGW